MTTTEKKKKKKYLSKMQKRFCEEYLVDLNQSAAALRAGFKPKSKSSIRNVACQLMKNEKVQEYIEKLFKEQMESREVTPSRILEELSRIAFTTSKDVLDRDGNVRKLSDLPDDVASAVSCFKLHKYVNKKGRPGERYQYFFHSKLRALEKLATFVGLDTAAHAADIITLEEVLLKIRERRQGMVINAESAKKALPASGSPNRAALQ